MATYTASLDTAKVLDSADVHIGEKHIYGSSRLGIVTANYSTDANTDGLNAYTSPWTGAHLPYFTGKKQYELTNHLGNVLATITDKKIGISLSTDSSLIDHYEADVMTAQDYYPFGMIMPGRMYISLQVPGGSVTGTTQVNGYTVPVDLTLNSRAGDKPSEYVATQFIDLVGGFESGDSTDVVTAYLADTSYAGTGNGGSAADGVAGQGKYRYGFNGKEKDDEVKGVGDQIDYNERPYDPRRGQWLSVDNRSKPDVSPFQYSANNPINYIDPDGQDEIHFTLRTTQLHFPNGRVINLSRPVMSIQIIPKAGADVFFYHKVDKVMNGSWSYDKKNDRSTLNWKLSGELTRSVTQFYPNGDGPNGQGDLFKGTGVTTSPGALPFMERKDEDFTSLAKLASPELIKYLEAKDPKKYGNLGFANASVTLSEGVQRTVGVLLLLEGSTVAFSSATEALAGRTLSLEESQVKGAHFLSRHGAQTTLEQQFTRATSGLTPDGVLGKTSDASRFLSNKIQLDALNKAKDIFKQTGQNSFSFDMGSNVGEGYINGGGPAIRTTQVQAVFRNGQLYTMYPKLK